MKIFNKIINKASNIRNKFKTQPQLIQISQRIYHCPYPSNPQIFTQLLSNLSPQQIQIWNLSQYQYSKDIYEQLYKLGFNIHQLTYQFYSYMPLTTSLTSMNVIEKFIRNSEHNYIFVHCQENKSRSILFLAAYMYWSGKISDVASALAYVNQKLCVKSNQTVYSSQHLILRNIANFHKDPSFINKFQLKLHKIIIKQAPKLPFLQINQQQPIKVLLQIRKNSIVIYKKLIKMIKQNGFLQFVFKQQNILLSDDCLFSFKYVFNDKIYPVMRIQLNTNFILNSFLRVQMQQIDLSKNVQVKGHVFTDFLFTQIKNTQSDLSKLTYHGIVAQANKKNQAKKQAKKQIKNQINISKVQKIIQSLPKKQQEQDKNNYAFNIHQEDKQFDQSATEQQINKLLDKMAKNKAQAQQDLLQINQQYQQYNIQQQKQVIKVENIQITQRQNIQADIQKNIKTKMQQNKEQEQDQIDFDDYLNKLVQDADQNG